LIDPESKYALSLYYIDFVSTIIFITEAIMKITAYGVYFCGPNSYLRSTWNRLDFLIVIFSIISITPLSNDYKAFKVFRILRLISRNDGLKVAVKSLLLGLPNILSVTVIMLLFFLIFGVISVS
jgi:Ion transport protein